MPVVDVTTQQELDDALARGDIPRCIGDGHFTVVGSASVEAGGSASVKAWGSASVEAGGSASVRAWGSASVRAWGSASVEAWGSASVEAWDSASVRAWDSASVEAWDSASVEAWDSASVRAGGSASVRAWGSASVRAGDSASVRAWDSASVRAGDSASVRAWDSASVRAGGSASVRAGKYCAIIDDGPSTTIEGGGSYLRIPEPTTPAEWCDLHDAAVDDDGIVVLYKAVSEQFRSPHGTSYAPGTMPEAPDWDGGAAECGGGLHLCAHPVDCLQFYAAAPRFVACPVRIDDIAVHQPANMPSKVKVPRIARPCYEVTIDGDPIPPASNTPEPAEAEAAAP